MDAYRRSGAAYVVDVSPADLGVRVVLRHLLPGGGATDVLGHLTSWTDGVLVVASRGGPVTVREADLLAAKRIPEPPARR